MYKKKIAIIGAGFGGVSTCKELAKSSNVEIDLIDRRNHHLFQPLLYQVAMAGLNPADISVPIRKLFARNKNVQVVLAEVDSVDVKNGKIQFDGQTRRYDYIILACGAKHFYFGNNDWEQFAPGLKNIEQATEIRRRVLTAFEMAEKEADPEKQMQYLTFAVVGAGPTGVELAGAISEMAAYTLRSDFKKADLSKTRVVLIEAGDRVLAAFPEKLSARAEQDLQRMGVEIVKQTRASNLSAEGLNLGENFLSCRTILWAAGVKPASLTDTLSTETSKQGRVIVKPDLSIPSNENVFVIGDQASFSNNQGGDLPEIAPVAIQQGQFLGKLIRDELNGKPRGSFKYWDKGIMATIGKSKAVVHSGNLNLTGFLAWAAWVFIHVVYLMRFRNKFFVFLQWVWAYFTFGRGARLIVHKSWRFYDGKKIDYT